MVSLHLVTVKNSLIVILLQRDHLNLAHARDSRSNIVRPSNHDKRGCNAASHFLFVPDILQALGSSGGAQPPPGTPGAALLKGVRQLRQPTSDPF